MEETLTLEELKPIDLDVSLSKNGNNEAFQRLIHNNQHSMYRIAKNILGDENDVEDAIADTILKAYSSINSLKKNESFKPWLLRILINRCYKLYKKKKKEIVIEEFETELITYEDSYENFELKQAIRVLDEAQRTVIILFYYEDMSIREISKTLNLPEGTVKSRLDRAKKRLRELIKE